MSIIYCEKHNRRWDSDNLQECPDCENEVCCADCGLRYGDEHGFPDLVVPDDVWKIISPGGHEGGLLCPSCLCRRAHDAGVTCKAQFNSGPFAVDLDGVAFADK